VQELLNCKRSITDLMGQIQPVPSVLTGISFIASLDS